MTIWTCPACRSKHDEAATQPRRGAAIDIGARHRAALGTHRCPNPDCGETTLDVFYFRSGADHGDPDAQAGTLVKAQRLIPASRARTWPDYVPAAVRADYAEACRSEASSAKASAALARRCLHGVMLDFFTSDAPLPAALERAMYVTGDDATVATLRALGQIANVRATAVRDPSIVVDVQDGEASLMIDLLELLLENTYVARQQRRESMSRLRKIAESAGRRGAVKDPGVATPPLIRGYVFKMLRNVAFLKYR